jgi:Fe(3+) dicitrate transport protein
MRAKLARDAELEVTAFRMDFENQIVPASVAGGTGATLTSAGETLHEGAEIALRTAQQLPRSEWRGSARLAYTWLPSAEYVGTRFSSVAGFTQVSVSGNRLPYASERLGTLALALESPRGWRFNLEGVYTGAQFTDDLNTRDLAANGQRGRIGGYAVWNFTTQYDLRNGLTLFASGKNVGDKLYIADLSRGIIPGSPRLVQVGFEYDF